MNGYPKIFNIESDPREEYNIGAVYEWVIGPALKRRGGVPGQRSPLSEPSRSEHHALPTRRLTLDARTASLGWPNARA
jgi:hypothetical protein